MQQIEIGTRQHLTGTDAISLPDHGQKAFALELHRINANVNKHIQPVLGAQGVGMLAVGNAFHRAVDRAVNRAVCGVNGKALTKQSRSKRLVGHLGKRETCSVCHCQKRPFFFGKKHAKFLLFFIY